MSAGLACLRLEGFRQPSLPEDCVGRMPAGYADRHREIASRDRAAPNFMAALALANEFATGRQQQFAESSVELGCHSGGGPFSFTQRRDLKEHRGRIQIGMIVRQKIEGHRRHFRQQTVKSCGIRSGRYVVTMSAPDRSLVVPDGRNSKDDWLQLRCSSHSAIHTTANGTKGNEYPLPQAASPLSGRAGSMSTCRTLEKFQWTR